IASDGQTVNINIQLSDNGIQLPVYLYDANNFLYDIQGTGAVGQGTAFDWYGDGSTNRNGFLLSLNVNGTSTPFTGGTVGTTENGQRQIDIHQNVGGLDVTRKAYVAKDGYFIRYVESMTNNTGAPITVSPTLESNQYAGNPQIRVISTSSGDSTLDV